MNLDSTIQEELLDWFEAHKRDLPWRKNKDPYSIWISEVMLQQTTSQAVKAYYQNFLKELPSLHALAKAPKKQVFALWAGLGYYNRAENLRKASHLIAKQGHFPKTYKELLKLPGFGPYTARAVSSLAFEENVGVLDGNVIRFLSRFHGVQVEYWKLKERNKLQKLSDTWVKNQKSSQMNQALMELGSLICKSPQALCLLCPVRPHCQAFKKNLQNKLPLKKQKKETEYWLYQVQRIKNNQQWAFVKNIKIPFLKGKLIPPGKAIKIKNKAKNYDFTHNITNYQIFVKVQDQKTQSRKNTEQNLLKNKTHSRKNTLTHIKNPQVHWNTLSEIQSLNPSSLIKKILEFKL